MLVAPLDAVGHAGNDIEVEGTSRTLDLATFVAILSLLVAILSYANDKQSESISKQDAQRIVEEALRAVDAEKRDGRQSIRREASWTGAAVVADHGRDRFR